MTSLYTPKPGSVPDRALKHLQSLPLGTTLTTGELAQQLGLPSGGLQATLESAVSHGLIVRTRRLGTATSRGGLAYRLPGIDAFELDDIGSGMPVQRVVPATPTDLKGLGPPSVFDMGMRIKPGEQTVELELASATPPATPSAPAGLNWKAPAHPKPREVPAEAPPAKAGEAAAATRATEPAEPFQCALWSNGELWLRIDGAKPLVLDRAKTEHLIHYLDRLSIELSPTNHHREPP